MVLLACTELPLIPVDKSKQQQNWDHYGNTAGGSRFVALDQITRDNVKDLTVAWTYQTGDVKLPEDVGETTYQVTPLKVGDNLFICTPHSIAIAVDADTGKERWRFDPAINREAEYYQHMTCRGLAYHDAAAYAEPAVAVMTAQVREPSSVPGDAFWLSSTCASL